MVKEKEITIINCDEIKTLDFDSMNCSKVLDFWNIISDISHSAGFEFIGDKKDKRTEKVYDKLFHGCNLPMVNKTNIKYVPKWNYEEKKILSSIIEKGYIIILEMTK